MHILVTNDDGPPSAQSSPYISTFVRTLRAPPYNHTVSVILPHTQRSWIGKAHLVGHTLRPTYFRPRPTASDPNAGIVTSRPLPPRSQEEEWVLLDSTPASCVQVGLHHAFRARGLVDLVVSGPNYGRNTTALFALSSGTLGGALEAACAAVPAVALSFAFFDRNHDAAIIAQACAHGARVVDALWRRGGWAAPGPLGSVSRAEAEAEAAGEGGRWAGARAGAGAGAGVGAVQLYSVNVPLVDGVGQRRTLWTSVLANTWKPASSCFQEIEVPAEEDEDAEEGEHEIREGTDGGSSEMVPGPAPQGDVEEAKGRPRLMHKHYKWAPKFADVYESVEKSEPGNDGWVVKERCTSVTPLMANFMHVPGFEGELEL
ncbi:survival protein sure-like phosphatase/nucleotidase [Lineolata rhizophorae]|uniref:Survival protein sure-like phosphatase/nucleotidase n=1 Tax=Lineolata rhizophorae TaxID=578093 RepID=A0A6A6PEG7_9PEZI|nr:survival protein sure-like phosphatase/nucleotidase [Lineolata rhizophorae]